MRRRYWKLRFNKPWENKNYRHNYLNAASRSLCRKINREAKSFVGSTRALASSNASAISPKANRVAKAGRGKIVGRLRTRPSTFVNSRFVTGEGEPVLTAQSTPLARIQ